jgi:hypothetical protein
MEPFPDINTTFSMIAQHESLNGLEVSAESDVQINLADGKKPNYTKGKSSNSGNGNRSCTFCGRGGHTIDICYRKNGYPPGFKYRDGSTPPKTAMASYIASTSSENKASEAKPTEAKFTNSLGLSDAEFHALKNLLKNHKSDSTPQLHHFTAGSSSSSVVEDTRGIVSFNSMSHSEALWIIDSGATDHACYSLTMFSSYTKVKPIPVRLPNGSIVKTDIIGDICITDSLTLTNVFYIPHFTYNLLSVSKVTKHLSCSFIFADSVCTIYDSQQRMIGSGKLLNGRYSCYTSHT